MRLRAAVAALVLVAASATLVLWWALSRPLPGPDLVALNDLSHRVAADWGGVDQASVAGFPGPISVLDAVGTVVLARGEAPTDDLAAAEAGAVVLPVRVDGSQVGTVLYVDPSRAAARHAHDERVAWVAAAGIAAAVLTALGVLGWTWHRVLRPFARLRAFAVQVAAGDLSSPLPMDRGRAFGAFTESFDLMRTELATARAREMELRESKQALVAQLSHDIRTPTASIRAVAELLQVDEPDTARRGRLAVIEAKAIELDERAAELSGPIAMRARAFRSSRWIIPAPTSRRSWPGQTWPVPWT